MEASIVSPALAPTWNFAEKLPSSSLLPLNLVVSEMRVSSDCSWVISFWMLPLASAFRPPSFEPWTDRSRMRCRMEVLSLSAPSAVCTTEMPSWVLRTATFRPPICERRPSEMASPAASSAARLMRKPEESFSSDLLIWPSVTDRLRYALSAAMLLLTRRPIVFLLGRGLPVFSRCIRAAGRAGVALVVTAWDACDLRRNRFFFSIHPVGLRSGGLRLRAATGRRPVGALAGEWGRHGAAPGYPIDVRALLVTGAHSAVGGHGFAVPHLAHRGVQEGQGPRTHLRDTGKGDPEVVR